MKIILQQKNQKSNYNYKAIYKKAQEEQIVNRTITTPDNILSIDDHFFQTIIQLISVGEINRTNVFLNQFFIASHLYFFMIFCKVFFSQIKSLILGIFFQPTNNFRQMFLMLFKNTNIQLVSVGECSDLKFKSLNLSIFRTSPQF